MRALIALAAITAVAGCVAALPVDSTSDHAAPNKLTSCSAGLPQEWKDQLARNQSEAGSHEQVTVVAANDKADTTLVKTTRNRTTELVLRDSKHRQQVMAVRDDGQISGVEFDGRWVTFSTTPDNQTYAWDSRNDGAPVRIGDRGAVVHNGKAAWSDGTDVHVYDLTRKKDKVVGKGERPVFFNETLLWRQDGKFRAPQALPEPLRSAKPDGDVASDGRTVVWTQGDALHGWRGDWPAPRELAEIKTVPKTEGIVVPHVSGDFVSWRSESSYVTDIRSGATTHTAEGSLEVRGGALTRQDGRVAAAAALSALSPLPAC